MIDQDSDPGRDGQSRRRALTTSDRRILDQVTSCHPDPIGFTQAENDAYAVAAIDVLDGIPDDSTARLYRNCPSAGRLEFRDSISAEPISLSNVVVLLNGDLERLSDPSSKIEVMGLCDGDATTGREFSVSGPEFVALKWIKREFGPEAWYRQDLRGHLLEGWIVCSMGQGMSRHGR